MRETIRQKPLVLLALLAIGLAVSGCTSDPEPKAVPSSSVATIPTASDGSGDVVAEVGDVSITRRQWTERLVSEHGYETLRSMLLEQAAMQEAEAGHIRVTDEELDRELEHMKQGYEDEDRFYDEMQEQLGMNREEVRADARYRLLLEKLSVRGVVVTEPEIDAYIDEHQADFAPRVVYRVAQIALEDENKANEVLAKLEDGDDFAKLAREYSDDDFTASDGGDLGWVESNDPFIAPALLEAASSMELGDITGPIETDQGFVLLQLNGTRETAGMSSKEIRDEAKRQLALSGAMSTPELEKELLAKYGAKIEDQGIRP